MVPALDNSAWKEARKIVQASPKWAAYWQNVTPRNFLTIEDFAELLERNHLHPIRIEKVQTKDPFVDRLEFLNFLLGTFTPAVPSQMAKEFWNEVIDEYLRLFPEAINDEGVLEARFGRIEIEAIYLQE
jgi:hypothetical protein